MRFDLIPLEPRSGLVGEYGGEKSRTDIDRPIDNCGTTVIKNATDSLKYGEFKCFILLDSTIEGPK
jgi:hypothetical protein